MLGVATMRATGARLGGTVRVRVADPAGVPHETTFRVIGRASLNAGTGGLGEGAVMTTRAFTSSQCPPGSGQAACQRAVSHGLATVVLVRAAPGQAGSAALARHIRQYRSLTYQAAEPTVLINFGQSVNFPLLFGAALSLFGAATLLHLLLVSVARRRTETGLLKVLGFVRRQVAAAVCWQATTVALAGVAVGVPAGAAVGRLVWRVFATNFGVVPGGGGSAPAGGGAGRRGGRRGQSARRRPGPAGRAGSSGAAAQGGVRTGPAAPALADGIGYGRVVIARTVET
jgi:hypothetical protein